MSEVVGLYAGAIDLRQLGPVGGRRASRVERGDAA